MCCTTKYIFFTTFLFFPLALCSVPFVLSSQTMRNLTPPRPPTATSGCFGAPTKVSSTATTLLSTHSLRMTPSRMVSGKMKGCNGAQN